MILSPRLFFLFALTLVGGYLLMPKPASRPRTVDKKAVDWVMTRMDASTASVPSTDLDGALETARAQQAACMDQVAEDLRPAQAPAPRQATLEELTVAALIRALEASLRSVPDAIPHLPLMPGMVHAIMRQDPGAIAFGPVPANAWAYYTPRAPGTGRPKIVLSEDLKRLHSHGVPTPLLADVLLHELDHWMVYALGQQKGKTRNQLEQSAFESEGYFLSAMLPNRKKGDSDAVDATGDPQRDAYLAELRKIRAKMFAGELPQMIRESYGPDPDEKASDGSSSSSQRQR